MKAVAIFIGLVFMGLVLTNLSYAAIDLESVVGVWLFDEGIGNTAADTSGNDNDGEFVNDPKWVQGIFGKVTASKPCYSSNKNSHLIPHKALN